MGAVGALWLLYIVGYSRIEYLGKDCVLTLIVLKITVWLRICELPGDCRLLQSYLEGVVH